MSGITAHVLDTALGLPAAGLTIRLAVLEGGADSGDGRFRTLAEAQTNADGRVANLLMGTVSEGTYKITFFTGAYFARCGQPTFFPTVEVQFILGDAHQHYHIPLLLSPFGYSTYRGS